MNRKTAPVHILLALGSLFYFGLLNSCVQPPKVNTTPLPVQMAELNLASGVSAFYQGDLQSARIQFTDALALYRSIDYVNGMANASLNLAKTFMAAGNVTQARLHLHQARTIAEKEGLTELGHHLDLQAASLAILERQFAEARALLAPYLPGGEFAAPVNGFTLAALQNRILIAQQTAPAEAPEWIERYARAVAAAPDSSQEQARLYRFRAALADKAGDRQGRDEAYQKALAIYRSITARSGIAATLTEWARDGLAANQLTLSDDLLQRALSVRVGMHDIAGCIEVMELMLSHSQKAGDTQKSLQVQGWLTILKKISPERLPALLPTQLPLREMLGPL